MNINDFWSIVHHVEVASISYRLIVDLISLVLLAFGLFYPRHKKRDILVMLVAFNMGIFIVLTVIVSETLSAGVGFGLFAILSIIRLRSGAVDNIELSYLFMSLALGLINGFGKSVTPILLALNFLIILTMALFDVRLPRGGKSLVPETTMVHKRGSAIVDQIVTSHQAARELLQSKLDFAVEDVVIESVDFAQARTKLRFNFVLEILNPETQEKRLSGNGVVAEDEDD